MITWKKYYIFLCYSLGATTCSLGMVWWGLKQYDNFFNQDPFREFLTNQSITDFDEESQLLNFTPEKKLAYRGLQYWFTGLNQDPWQTHYELLAQGDAQLFIPQVIKGTLNTVSTPLMQATLDFLGEKLNQHFFLNVNGNHLLSTTKSLTTDLPLNPPPLSLNLSNQDNFHFFLQTPQDTPGDGYCFFHALIKTLDAQLPDWHVILS